jgi:hypothetical protein
VISFEGGEVEELVGGFRLVECGLAECGLRGEGTFWRTRDGGAAISMLDFTDGILERELELGDGDGDGKAIEDLENTYGSGCVRKDAKRF